MISSNHSTKSSDQVMNSDSTQICTITFPNQNTFQMPIPHVPLTSDSYCQSFNVDTCSDEEIQQFFSKYGFIVFDNVLNQDQVQATVSDIFDILETNTNNQFQRHDTTKWNSWPENALEHFGNVSIPSIFSRQFLMNRQNEKVVKAFSRVFQLPETELIVSHDRASFYRPPKLNSKYKTKANLHLDCNPAEALDEPEKATVSYSELNRLHYSSGKGHFITENNHICTKRDGLQVQALINLNDNLSEDGGLIVVPGFHQYFSQFFELSGLVNDLGRGRPSFAFKPRDRITGEIYQLAQRIPSKAGSLIIWNQLLAHGSAPTDMQKSKASFRSAMYLRMFPKSMLLREGAHHRRKNRREALRKKIHLLYLNERRPLELSPLGRAVFDIDDEGASVNSENLFDPTPPYAASLKPLSSEKKSNGGASSEDK
ncbi:hypothetical protein C9374_014328 [Naegleria lovaniensis]|uniref:Phytanoyl-CoA dioxygenase n=1 Tax=Naegleria lovaniensis TaxID=51637 RepID=A0AA88KP12_NAELO|nr:uncharacterized protein C9374_014328 [Naegleria lovaniensis]KAG2388928.1 hypothetical protein C9374_014328 [Naegleria lovaniensis]